MERIKMYDTETSFSRLIAGCMRWGQWGARYDKTEMCQLIKDCLDLGISTFDHADIYGDYTTEADFGKAFLKGGISRDNIQLISKCGIKMLSANRPENKIKSYDLSKAYIISSVEKSLENLQTDYLDLLLLHRPSPLMQADIVAEAFTELKDKGMVKAFGVSNFSISQFDMLKEYFPLCTNQIEISILNRTAFVDGTLEELQKRKIHPQAWSPLAADKLFNAKNKLEQERVEALSNLCMEYDWSLTEMALKFLCKHPSRLSPIIGTTKSFRIKEAVEALEKNISDEQWFEIWTAASGEKVA